MSIVLFIILNLYIVFIFMIGLVRWLFCWIRFKVLWFSFFRYCLWGPWLLDEVIFIYVRNYDIFSGIFRFREWEARPSFLERFSDVGCFSLCSCCRLCWFLCVIAIVWFICLQILWEYCRMPSPGFRSLNHSNPSPSIVT